MARKKVLLTLGQIAERTGISYGTLVRYAKLHEAKIPSEGTGRKKRYPPSAVKVFEQLRERTKRGRPLGAGADSTSSEEHEFQEVKGKDYTLFLGLVDEDKELIAGFRKELALTTELLLLIRKSIAFKIDGLGKLIKEAASTAPGLAVSPPDLPPGPPKKAGKRADRSVLK
jgi:hypothetical protein